MSQRARKVSGTNWKTKLCGFRFNQLKTLTDLGIARNDKRDLCKSLTYLHLRALDGIMPAMELIDRELITE